MHHAGALSRGEEIDASGWLTSCLVSFSSSSNIRSSMVVATSDAWPLTDVLDEEPHLKSIPDNMGYQMKV